MSKTAYSICREFSPHCVWCPSAQAKAEDISYWVSVTMQMNITGMLICGILNVFDGSPQGVCIRPPSV